MAAEVVGGRPSLTRLKTTTSGAITQNATFTFDPQTDGAYRAFLGSGFEAVQVMSPVAAAGAADLRVVSASFDAIIPGGGNVLTVPGPVSSLRITALNAAVAGSGADDVRITPIARLKTGAL